MIPRAADSRPASPAASLGVPVGVPSFAGGTARSAHAPSAELGAGGDRPRERAMAREVGSDGVDSDTGADLVAGGALLEAGLAQRNPPAVTKPSASDPISPFVPARAMPTDGTAVESIDIAGGAGAAAVTNAAHEDGLTADGPGDPGGAAAQGDPGGDVEGGGTLSDSINEGVGGTSAPNEAPPADAGAEGADH